MPSSRTLAAAALLAALAACQENKEAPATNEPSEAPVPAATTPGAPVPDAAAPAISNPASPTPEGTDVGAMGTDATAAPLPGDTATAGAAHP